MPVQPWRFFQLIFSNLIEKGRGFILLAQQDDHCLAAGLFLHWNHTLTYKYSASSDKGQNLRPNHLLTWTAIRWGCEHGFQSFDFGRTDVNDEGLRTYKHRWGAEELPLNYFTIPGRSEQPSSGKLMRTMQTIIQNSPVWVCKLAGEALYKHFA
jgi:CelD/BcsL family acetyltransferase involved in cellulose biosynthesis